MGKYKVVFSNRFKRAYKLAQKRNLQVDKLVEVIAKLSGGHKLEAKYRDHALTGNYKGYRECHIQPDWLLVYKIENDMCVLLLVDTGTHADIFDM